MSDTDKKSDGAVVEDAPLKSQEDLEVPEDKSSIVEKSSATQKNNAKANSKQPVAKKPKADVIESDSGDDDKDESDEEDEEPRLGLLEQPIQIESGKRERKKVERLSEQLSAAVKSSAEKKPLTVEGTGQKLGDCPEILSQIQKQASEDLRHLHKVLYGRPGSTSEVKRNVRKFCGFTFEKGSDEYNKKIDAALRMTTQALKEMCGTLGQERTGSKEQIAERIMDFLLNPKSSGKTPRKSRKGKAKGKKKAKAASGDAAAEEEKSDDKEEQKDAKDDSGASGMDSAAEGEGDIEAAGDQDDEEQETPKKSSAKSPKKDTAKAKKPKAEKPKEPKAKKAKADQPKDTKAKKAKADQPKDTKAKKAKVEQPKEPKAKANNKRAKNGNGSSSGSDEPLAKKSKKEPTEDDLKKLIKKILDSANLEEVTMKTVIKKVFSEYPNADLTPKKDFIKDTVKQILGA